MEKKSSFVVACVTLLGVVLAAFVLGRSIERFKKEDRYVSVKGFAEQEAKADLAVWTLRIRVVNDDLSEGSKAIEAAKDKVVQFLTQHGINTNEIIQHDLKVTDKQANEYGSTNVSKGMRYIIEKTILVRSVNVDNIQQVSRMTDELLRVGVAVSGTNDWQGSGPKFIFTKLNDIKPGMLAEATRNAKLAAVQFAKESGTTLGNMRKANQGLFSIADRDESVAVQSEGGGYASGTSDINKKVRVVISVDYFIE